MGQAGPTETDLGQLPPHTPRVFVPADADLTDAATAVSLHEKLLEREVSSAGELERWLLDRSELEAVMDQAGSVLYARMTCQTDNDARAEAYRQFIQTVVPAVKPLAHRLNEKYQADRERFSLDAVRYEVHDRAVEADVALFRPENVPLQTEEALLSQDYQTVYGAMTVEFQGEERTLPQMRKFLLETNRPVRRDAWRAVARRRLQDRGKLDDIFEKMLDLRGRIAANAGAQDYQAYKFREYHRFDYMPEDCARFRDAVASRVVPLCDEIQRNRRSTLGLEALRPWDLSVDPEGRAPLKPFERSEELVAGVLEAFRRTDPALGEQFAEMDRIGLLDLASRKGKAPGGYQTTLQEARKPFIFMNTVGLDMDLRTLLHEGGHAFHAFACAADPLVDYRHAPMEFCEVASMGMELLAGEHLSAFYGEEDLARSRREHLEGIVLLLPWVATIDGFQDWLYSHPGHRAQERRSAWLAVRRRFMGEVVDWGGLDEEHAYLWHRQLHLFEVPFYYIEYGIAQLGALQLWVRARRAGAQALADYRSALALGGSRPLPELFEAAGLRFDFSEETLAPLMDAVAEELSALGNDG